MDDTAFTTCAEACELPLHRMQVSKTDPHLFELLFHLGIECSTGRFLPVGKTEKSTNGIKAEAECTTTSDEEQSVVLLVCVETIAGGCASD